MAFLERFLQPSDVNVQWVDEDLTRGAIARWLRPHRDKTWSLTDAVSFEVMQRDGIREAFAFDEHFEQAGFTVL
ncbi:MAG: hypothetical protein HY337_05445 [Gemmatimonadetes bacterium]|nr:hypothetical protein [Gemmatimonadota bacterium]